MNTKRSTTSATVAPMSAVSASPVGQSRCDESGFAPGSAPDIRSPPSIRLDATDGFLILDQSAGIQPPRIALAATEPSTPAHPFAPPSSSSLAFSVPSAFEPTPADNSDVDEPMSSLPAVAAPPAPADPRPTMADLFKQQETIRHNETAAEAKRSYIEAPKPLACDIELIERQYAAKRDWSYIAFRMDQARPYELPRAKFDMVIATGRTFAKTPLQRIMASLAGSNHENEILEDLYRRHEIGQVSKFPGGNLRVKVKSKEACLKLERTKVIILGGIFQFKEYDVLANKNYLDISNVDSDTNTDVILLRLFILGCQPIYDTFREVNMATGITSATWRVYFLPKSCPPQLMANGSVCDQILFDNKLHPAHGKNAPYQSERLPYGFRSHHGIDLLTSDDIFPANTPSATLTATTQPTQAPEKLPHTLKSFAATKRPALSKTRTQGASGRVKTSLQQAVGEIKKRDAKLTGGAQHGKSPAADNQLALIPRKPRRYAVNLDLHRIEREFVTSWEPRNYVGDLSQGAVDKR